LRFKIILSNVVALPKISVSDSLKLPGAAMIKFLAELFRGLHYIVGISAPPSDISDRKFVFVWLVGIAVVASVFVALVLIVPFLYFRR
jgi:hypothetical protein